MPSGHAVRLTRTGACSRRFPSRTSVTITTWANGSRSWSVERRAAHSPCPDASSRIWPPDRGRHRLSVTRATAPAARALPVVAHCCTPYLFATGSWLYSQLVHLERHEPIVLTDRTENLDVFPFREVYAYNEIHPVRKAFFCLKRGRLGGGREPYCESVLRRRQAVLIHSHFGYVGWRMLECKPRLGLPMLTSFYGADASRLPRDPVWRAPSPPPFPPRAPFLPGCGPGGRPPGGPRLPPAP